MTDITFHSGPTGIARIEHCCCQLVEHLFLKGGRVLLHSGDRRQLQRLNQMLWEFEADSFVPHAPLDQDGAGDGPPHPVALSAGDDASLEAALNAPPPARFSALVIAPGGRIPQPLQQLNAEQLSALMPQIHYMVLKNDGAEYRAAGEDFRTLQQITGAAPQHRQFS